MEMAKAVAFLCGYEFVVPEHVQEIFLDVCGHRVRFQSMAVQTTSGQEVLLELLASVKAPAIR